MSAAGAARSGVFWVGFAVLALAVFSYAWVGYIASDAIWYIEAAEEWLDGFPFVPANHWEVRHPVNLSLALAYSLFGRSEMVSLGVTLVYVTLLFGAVYVLTRDTFGAGAARAALALLAVTPLVVEQGTMLGVDTSEAALVLAAFTLFWKAVERDGATPWLLAAGFVAGIAFLNRETSGALLLWLGVAFLFGAYIPRWKYWIMALAFFVPLAVEIAYYAIVAGDPLLRFKIVLGTVDNVSGAVGVEGNLASGRLLGPTVALLANNEFGLLYWLALPASIWLVRVPLANAESTRLARALVGLMAATFLTSGFLLDLRAVPRYFTLMTALGAVVVAVWLWLAVKPRAPKLAAALAVVLVSSNLLFIDLSNRDPRFAARALVDLLRAEPGLVVHTDPELKLRTYKLLDWAGVDGDRIRTDPPPPGGLLLHFGSTREISQRKQPGLAVATIEPDSSWETLWRKQSPMTVAGRVASALGFPPETAPLPRRFYRTNPPLTLYRRAG